MEKVRKFSATKLEVIYQAYSNLLIFESELHFWYRPFKSRFCLNTNPLADESLQDMLDTKMSMSNNEISFHLIDDLSRYVSEYGAKVAWDNHKENEYFVKESSIYEHNKVVYQIISSINNGNKVISLNENDAHNIKILFDKGKMLELAVSPRDPSQGIPSINIDREEGGFILIEYKPFRRTKLKNLSINNSIIYYSHEGGDFSYPLDISQDVYAIIEELLNLDEVLT